VRARRPAVRSEPIAFAAASAAVICSGGTVAEDEDAAAAAGVHVTVEKVRITSAERCDDRLCRCALLAVSLQMVFAAVEAQAGGVYGCAQSIQEGPSNRNLPTCTGPPLRFSRVVMRLFCGSRSYIPQVAERISA
jgi:hypothetical protein